MYMLQQYFVKDDSIKDLQSLLTSVYMSTMYQSLITYNTY